MGLDQIVERQGLENAAGAVQGRIAVIRRQETVRQLQAAKDARRGVDSAQFSEAEVIEHNKARYDWMYRMMGNLWMMPESPRIGPKPINQPKQFSDYSERSLLMPGDHEYELILKRQIYYKEGSREPYKSFAIFSRVGHFGVIGFGRHNAIDPIEEAGCNTGIDETGKIGSQVDTLSEIYSKLELTPEPIPIMQPARQQ